MPRWKPVYAAEGDVGPLSALEVNDGASPGPSRTGPSGTSASGLRAAALQAAASANPAVRAAATFTDLLASDGVRVVGAANSGTAPLAVPVLTAIASPALGAEVDAMLTVSDDTAAELFTKELGYQAAGPVPPPPAWPPSGPTWRPTACPSANWSRYDGSGLDRGDRVTCALLQADLQHAGRRQRGGGRAADRRPDRNTAAPHAQHGRRGSPEGQDGHAG